MYCGVKRHVTQSTSHFYFLQQWRQEKCCMEYLWRRELHWTIFRATYVATKLLEELQEKLFSNHSAVKREQTIFMLGSQ